MMEDDEATPEEEEWETAVAEFIVDVQEVVNGETAMTKEERSDWATDMLVKKQAMLDDPALSPHDREVISTLLGGAISAALAGMAFSVWLPRGMPRKAIMFGVIGAGALALVLGHLALGIILLLLAIAFSPRALGNGMMVLGVLIRYRIIILIAIVAIAWLIWRD